MNGTSGRLRPAVEAYLTGAEMTDEQIAAMRAYLRQWIAAPAWRGPNIPALRGAVDGLTTVWGLRQWLDLALENGIDPL
jgi:hypothetical protein